jgi:hypothetical protein
MSFIISTQAEVLKTKRTASFWFSILAAAFVPVVFLLIFIFNPEDNAFKSLAEDPWRKMFSLAWQFFGAFALPVYIILMSTLIPQIEIKNHTWKQVFASPQSLGNIYFSKFAAIQLMILFAFVLFNLFMLLVGVSAGLMYEDVTFFHYGVDVKMLLVSSFKEYISILGISAIQYFLSLRFKNFVAPIGIGLALVIGSIVALNFQWQHLYKLPYTYPILSADSIKATGRPLLENHEWNSIGYFICFTLIGFLYMKMKKERG